MNLPFSVQTADTTSQVHPVINLSDGGVLYSSVTEEPLTLVSKTGFAQKRGVI